MILDFNPSTGAYFLKVPRGPDRTVVQGIIRDQGFDFSSTGSTAETAVLLTREPYAAATFAQYATPSARRQMGGILAAIEASYAPTTSWQPSWLPPDCELWDFQRADIEYALGRTHSLVGDQPGLGKTPVAICYANEIQAKHVLVVCPANIRNQWAKRIREWSRSSWQLGRDCIVHSITGSRRGTAPVDACTATWNIVSYDLARTPAIGRALARHEYDLLILDEAHYAKSIDAERTRAIFGGGDKPRHGPLANQCKRILALTGTPLPNRPREAYVLARGLEWGSIDYLSEDRFRERFNPSRLVEGQRADGTSFRFVDERTGRHGELQNRLRANFMVRHLKRMVMPQLKLPVYDLIQVDETGAVKQALAAESLLEIDPEDLTGADAVVLGHIAAVRRMMGIAIAPQVADYVKMLLLGGEEKLVLFGWHIEVLNILEERLSKHGLVRIDGSTSAAQKDKRVERFIKEPGIQIILGNMQSMGVGTDGLQQVSCHALLVEPSWTPGDNQQAVDRLDRGGQRHTVQADIFVAPGSIAERVLASALRKLATTHAALDKRMAPPA